MVGLPNSVDRARYPYPLATIQVKNVPPELHERLRARACAEGRNLSAYVRDVLERDLLVPSMREWLDSLAHDEPVSHLVSEETVEPEASSGDIEAKLAVIRKAASYETSGREVDIDTMLAETEAGRYR